MREEGTGLVGVEVEEQVALAAYEVVAGGRPSACDTDGLRVCETVL